MLTTLEPIVEKTSPSQPQTLWLWHLEEGIVEEPGYLCQPFLGYTKFREKLRTDDQGSHHQWKPCQHYKCWCDVAEVREKIKVPAEDGPSYTETSHPEFGFDYGTWGELGCPLNGIASLVDWSSDDNFVARPNNLSDLNAAALKSMLPLIKSELSLINSIYELKDIVSIKSTVQNLRNFIVEKIIKRPNFLKGLGKIPTDRHGHVRTLGTLGTMGDTYLQYMFNIGPLISDVRGIYRALDRYERRINGFLNEQGRPKHKHFRYVWAELPPNEWTCTWRYDPAFQPTHCPDITFINTRKVVPESTVFHAQIEYTYQYTQFQAEHARLVAILDAWGVNMNPRIIWAAIPWSFVVDWLVGIGRWLDQFTMMNAKPVINIHRYCWSVSRKRNTTVWIKPHYRNQAWGTELEYRAATLRETAYRRDTDMPTASSITSSGLSLTEFSLGASLVVTRRRRRHH